ncbi:MAG: exonuclease subunit SbcD [Cyanobacteria bacterium P01_H01_bin.15]
MAIKVLHLSDIHLGSGFSHGRLNERTGRNSRLEDFLHCLNCAIDRAIDEPVDLVLFGGDAFPDATPPPYIHEAFGSAFRRLADAQIPTVLLVGNHDQHAQSNGGASLCIYRTLGVPGFIVGDRLATHRITTRQGPIQVITLPWLTHHTLLTRPETEDLSLPEINELLIQRLAPALEGEIRQLEPQVPTILLGHLMCDRALLGAEKFLAVGKGFTVPLGMLTRSQFDYVALGHVHKHQNLNLSNDPPVVYPGSIERVDFSEEKEDKGYVLARVTRGQTNWEFCPLPARPFSTIKVDVREAANAQAEILKSIQKKDLTEAVVRVIYQLRAAQVETIDQAGLQAALANTHSFALRPEVISQLARPRVPELTAEQAFDPLTALKTYLKTQPDLEELAGEIVSTAEKLLCEDEPSEEENTVQQLELL